MTNYTLKSAGLIIITLFSTQVMANSPWADDTESEKVVTEEPVSNESMPLQQHENDNPVMHDETVEPVGLVQTDTEEVHETEPAPEAAMETETVQQGDVLNETSQVAAVRLLDFPRRGMTTDKVENELGRPGEIIPSVGQPPISRWVYDDRTVYFEYSSVIHVVAK